VKLLIDTHALLWFATDDRRLSQRAESLMRDSHNELIFSVASIWEIVIKVQKGLLKLNAPPPRWLRENLGILGARTLPIRSKHALRILRLPLHHRDPFDRLIIAQADVESMTVLSRDAILSSYLIKVMWCFYWLPMTL